MSKYQIVFRLAELFCGPGGLAFGAKNACVENLKTVYRVEPVWAIDNHVDSCETYRDNIHPESAESVVCGQIEKLNIDDMPQFDALAFGFPCNDFSIVGEQKGVNGKFGPLYSYGVKILNARSPQWFMAENVGGIQNANEGRALKVILEELAKAGKGYRLTPHFYKFEEYGVPQYRHRIVIIGIRNDIGLEFKVPAPISSDNFMTAKTAIEIPPIPRNAANNELTKQSPIVIERLKYIPPGKNAWYEGIPDELKLNVKGAKLSQIYKRLDPNKPAYTVTGSGGGGTHGYHWQENRSLTNRERARLQTFPDDFVFKGLKESVRRQIGMAVPPKVVKIIIEAVLKTFAREQYEYVEAKLSNGRNGNQYKMNMQLF